jgi:hypothetical protein
MSQLHQRMHVPPSMVPPHLQQLVTGQGEQKISGFVSCCIVQALEVLRTWTAPRLDDQDRTGAAMFCSCVRLGLRWLLNGPDVAPLLPLRLHGQPMQRGRLVSVFVSKQREFAFHSVSGGTVALLEPWFMLLWQDADCATHWLDDPGTEGALVAYVAIYTIIFSCCLVWSAVQFIRLLYYTGETGLSLLWECGG